MNSEAAVVVEGPSEEDVKNQFDECLRSAAITSLIAGLSTGYLTGGAGAIQAALAAFGTTLTSCIENGIGKDIDDITTKIENNSIWDEDWS